MVQLTTDVPQVQDPDLNILLGSFQRSSGSILGSIAQGVETGVEAQATRDRRLAAANASAIDDDLFGGRPRS